MKTKRNIVMHSQGTYTCRAPTQEVIEAMGDLTSGAFKLLMYYYSKSTGWDFSDEAMASTIGVTKVTLVRLKKELVDKGYLHIEVGKRVDNYFVGKKAVFEWKFPEES